MRIGFALAVFVVAVTGCSQDYPSAEQGHSSEGTPAVEATTGALSLQDVASRTMAESGFGFDVVESLGSMTSSCAGNAMPGVGYEAKCLPDVNEPGRIYKYRALGDEGWSAIPDFEGWFVYEPGDPPVGSYLMPTGWIEALANISGTSQASPDGSFEILLPSREAQTLVDDATFDMDYIDEEEDGDALVKIKTDDVGRILSMTVDRRIRRSGDGLIEGYRRKLTWQLSNFGPKEPPERPAYARSVNDP